MVQDYLSDTVMAAMGIDLSEVAKCAEMIYDAWKQDASVWIVGNGGSASTAGHFANDLVKMARVKAFSVADMTPAVMAYGNDTGWDNMFAGVFDVMMRPQDKLVAISCGGRSGNVIKAAEMFRRENRVVLTGDKRDTPLGSMEAFATVFVPVSDIRIQEDVHVMVCHVIAGMVAERTRG